MKRTIIAIILVAMATSALAITYVVKPYTFIEGTKAKASEVNGNFDTIVSGINTAISAINTAAGSKTSLDGRMDAALNDDGTLKDYTDVVAFANFSTAKVSAASTGKPLYIRSGIAASCNTMTIPANVALVVEHGGTISQAGTLAINGPLRAHDKSVVFTGGGAVVLNPSTTKYVTPQMFGALADNSHDDTASIQAAANAHPSIFFPRGIYTLTSAITFPSGGRHIWGERANITGVGSWINQTTAAFHFVVSGTLGQANQYSEINHLTFTGSSGLGVNTKHTESLSVHDCSFSGPVNGLYMSVSANEQDVKPRIFNNTFANGAYGIYTGDTRTADAWIKDNTFINLTTAAIRIGYMDGGFIEGNFIGNDLSSGTVNSGILLGKPIFATIRANQLFEVNGYGIQANGARYSEIAGNRFVKTGKSARATALTIGQYSSGVNPTHLSVSENFFADVYGAAISFGNMTDSIIFNNQIIGAGYTATTSDAILFSNSDTITLRNNTIDGNSYTDGTADTRYWLNINTVTNLLLDGNTEKNAINDGTLGTSGTNTIKVAYRGKSKTVTAGAAAQQAHDDEFICNAVGGAITINLQPAATYVEKRIAFVKKDSSGNAVTIVPNGAETINGAASYVLSAQYKRVVIVSDGANWFIESAN